MNMNFQFTLDIFFLLIVLLLTALCYVLPVLTRSSVYFAITIDPAFRSTLEARHILRGYRAGVVLNAVLASALTALGMWTRVAWLAPAGVYWLALGNYFAFLYGRKATAPHHVRPTTVREAELVPRRERLPGGWLAQLGPFFLLLAIAMVLHRDWALIPERFPIHWGSNGQPNGFSDRTFFGVYGILFIAAIVCAVLALLALGIVYRTRKVELGGPGGARDSRVRRYNAIALLCVEYVLAISMGGSALLPLRGIPSPEAANAPPQELLWLMLLTLAVVAVAIVLLLRAARTGHERPATPSGHPVAVVGDSTPDARWVGGIFYFNREDPSLIVEKRFGVGYTLNFAHPAAWVIIGALACLPLVTMLLVPHRR
jgi:uncharacterized membrane protein